MDLTPYVQQLPQEHAPTVRLVLLDALSDAAEEITRDLAPGSVEVRLRGRDLEFVVTPATGPELDDTLAIEAMITSDISRSLAAATTAPPPPDAGDTGTSRVTLRLPEHLKPRIEEAAGRESLSVNAWLVRAVTDALEPQDPGRRGRRGSAGQRMTGWVR